MGDVRVIELASVRHEELCGALKAMGLEWEEACHVTATTSLTRTIIRHTTRPCTAIWIAGLIDLITAPGRPGEQQYPVDGFPRPSVLAEGGWGTYREATRKWFSGLSGRYMRLGIQFDDELRKWTNRDPSNSVMGQMLVKSRRGFSQTVQTLISAGVAPDDVSGTDPRTVQATEAWRALETALPALASLRKDLWIDWEEFEQGQTEHARDLRTRVDAALATVFGDTTGTRTVVYHGFYFYTPPQWALFQLLRRVPDVNQIFVVHDDGNSAVFEIWRNFFHPNWDMPWPERIEASNGATQPADALRRALMGEQIDAASLFGNLEILEYKSPSDFVRHCRIQQQEGAVESGKAPAMFAADSRTVSRYFRRLGSSLPGSKADLAQLPVGAFLLRLHDCLTPISDRGGVRIEITPEILIDIVGSGFLEIEGDQTVGPENAALLRRVAPFFRRCSSDEDWAERAGRLRRLVAEEVEQISTADPDHSDVERLNVAASNPLRRAPWADISTEEAKRIETIVGALVALLRELCVQERMNLDARLQYLRRKLAIGMRGLPSALQAEIQAKVDGFSIDLDGDVDVAGIVDAVRMLLGQEAVVEPIFEEDDDQDVVGSLRNLDSLGMTRLSQNVHLANLADGAFPAAVVDFGWPFSLDDIEFMPISREILEARIRHAPLADLYLLWLALDGNDSHGFRRRHSL